jgi:pimeloyl-ACP methyl ester carboxylesterase
VTIVLVHGNPETDAIWGPLVDALGRDDVVRLSPPGFGSPLPDDFPATYVAYRDWLEDELGTSMARSTSSVTTGVAATS